MKFDKTFIAIRERGILDILDLALHVATDHFRALACLLLIGVAPWLLFDFWLIGHLIHLEEMSGVYFWGMFLLVANQAQIGTTFMTRYLGQAMFAGKTTVAWTVRDVLKTTPYFYWIHGLWRMVIPVALLGLGLRSRDPDMVYVIVGFWIPFFVAVGILFRSLRPFVSEVLLLERTPISKKSNQVHFAKRSSSLHGASSSELFGRFVSVGFFMIPLGFACYAMFVSIDSVLNLQSNSEFSLHGYYWVVALWIIAGYAAIVRFLSYIDIRIRQEGWAVELRIRAEGQTLVGSND
ncbi:MAG: hypothetical protein AB8B55_22985 [Mariniblastus sp.]